MRGTLPQTMVTAAPDRGRCGGAPRTRHRGRLPPCRVSRRRSTDRKHGSQSAGARNADLDRHRRLRRLRARLADLRYEGHAATPGNSDPEQSRPSLPMAQCTLYHRYCACISRCCRSISRACASSSALPARHTQLSRRVHWCSPAPRSGWSASSPMAPAAGSLPS